MITPTLTIPPEVLMAAEVASRHEDVVRHSRSRWRLRRGSLSVRRGTPGRASVVPLDPIR